MLERKKDNWTSGRLDQLFAEIPKDVLMKDLIDKKIKTVAEWLEIYSQEVDYYVYKLEVHGYHYGKLLKYRIYCDDGGLFIEE